MKELNVSNFDAEIASAEIALVDFFATWCGPCRMMAPVLEEVDLQTADVSVFKIDVDQNPALADRFAIEAVPTLLFFKKGELVKKKTGVYPRDALDLILKEVRE